MAPPLLGGQAQADEQLPLPPALLLPPPSPPPDDDPASSSPEFGWVYRCPLFWCPDVICQWSGRNTEMYEHFVLDGYQYHGAGAAVTLDLNTPGHCLWPYYEQDSDFYFYRVLMRTNGNMVFFMSTIVDNGLTSVHVFYIGPEEKAQRYLCQITIENRGANLPVGPIFHLLLRTGPTDGHTDIITINHQYAVTLKNETLTECCDETGDLYLWIRLYVPEGEPQEEEFILGLE